jgi:NAD(P)-dependent dehydrogenase (short-subunit alcohol dehydrogenase family)
MIRCIDQERCHAADDMQPTGCFTACSCMCCARACALSPPPTEPLPPPPPPPNSLVCSPGSVNAAAAQVREAVGQDGLQGLVNNAGFGIFVPVECLTGDLNRAAELRPPHHLRANPQHPPKQPGPQP